ncbi:HIT family protein [Liquorilactobacillus oeni]|uniref:HIT family protein n=1 Tax=Liquorilactobacillus oeni DSM 19972 TaxID=1423777 RepID=A0A0R1M899_9LACO|nr:HIT family protein [Liquorilactobacillus oeni]KRL04439.1 HIT family protein [Liquorilactobacillus oeni DSM 19972]
MCLICERIQQIKKGDNRFFVKELATGYVVIGDNQHFKGYTLFLCKKHVTELYCLEPDFKQNFLVEMALVSEAVSHAFKAKKMNIELLGNGNSHLHWHLFPRQDRDLENYGINGKGPVWWYPKEKMFAEDSLVKEQELKEMKSKLLSELNKLI